MTSRKLARLPLIGTGIVPPSVGAPAGSFRSTRKTVSDTGRMKADSVRPDAADGRAVKLRHSPVKSLGDCLEHAGEHVGPSVSIGFGGGSFGRGTPPAAACTVESVGTNSFTVKGHDGTIVTVHRTATRFPIFGKASGFRGGAQLANAYQKGDVEEAITAAAAVFCGGGRVGARH